MVLPLGLEPTVTVTTTTTYPPLSLRTRLIHIVADTDFSMQHLAFASRWVVDEFVKRVVKIEIQGMIRLLRSTSGAILGSIFEATMHAVLPQVRLGPCRLLPYCKNSF